MSNRAGRANNGRFAKGNKLGKGRPPGVENQTTADLPHIRNAIVESWEQVDGQAKLVQLARDDFVAYLNILARFLPRETRIAAAIPFIEPDRRIHGPEALGFMAEVQSRANGGPVTPALVLETLDAHARGELDGSATGSSSRRPSPVKQPPRADASQ